jgi:hypothetical protein
MLWKYVSTVGIYKFLDVTIVRSLFTPKVIELGTNYYTYFFVDVR